MGRKLLQSGVIYAAINFVTGMGNLAFQAVMGWNLNGAGQYGDANSAIGSLMPLLGLPPQIATFAITHYIAHFDTSGDQARLQGLLLGCRKLLFWFTVGGSALAVIIVKPLSTFFHYSTSLMLITLACALFGLWGNYATALCQGLAWFKRLALIGFLAVVLRIGFGWFVTLKWPSAETAVLATGFAILANLVLLFWRKDLVLPGKPASPWSREFGYYFLVSGAFVIGGFCFLQGDLLLAKKFFSQNERDAYTAVGTLARAIPQSVAPLLVVMFTSRSGRRTGGLVADQLKLMGLSALALLIGAASLYVLRALCLSIIHRNTPDAAAMIAPFSIAMVFIGLLQGLAYWSLASRWSKLSLLYGGLGVAFWLTLLAFGRTPGQMLQVMPVGAGIAFVILFCAWLITMRHHKPTEPGH
jgi:hypothetical protein